jgi:hypothetical protein
MEFTRINSNSSGHPRFVTHFLNLLTKTEKEEEMDIPTLYRKALNRARKWGGRKFDNKQYGGGICFVSWDTNTLEKYIKKELKREEAKNGDD